LVTDSSPPQEKPSLEAGCAVACANSNLVFLTSGATSGHLPGREGDRANALSPVVYGMFRDEQ
jgi:hypothetical protein